MASSGNFCTLNRLNTRGSSASSQITNGNLQYNGQATQDEVGCTINVGNDGVPKVYFEVYIINNHDTGWLGIYDTKVLTLKYEKAYGTTSYRAMKFSTGQKVTGSTSSNYIGDGSANNSRSGQTVGVAIDVPNGKIWFAINNAWGSDGGGSPTDSNVAFTDLTTTGSYDIVTHMGGASVAQPDWLFNFGADSTMQGRETAGGNSDSNSVGDFRYSVPSGFEALSSKNINLSDDIDPAQTDDDFPSKQFGVVTYTGNGTARSFTGLGFQPDMLWIKMRNSGDHGKITDSVRGVQKALISNTTGAETTDTNGVTAFGTDGFSIGSGNQYNLNEYNFVAWCWRAGGTASSNTDGTTTVSLSANPKAGFSIITYTGTGSAGATIGHGLSAKPAFIIVKNRTDTDSWAIYHESIGADFYTAFSGAIFSNNATFWNDTEPTTSVITLGTNNRVNGSSDNLVCYAWAQIEGYSKFGEFQGNGNADGPFIYTGFRPRMLFIKRNANSHYWKIFDTARNTNNLTDNSLSWDNTDAESSSNGIDILSNGFKLRNSNSSFNNSGSQFVYGAWGDVPFKYNNTF
tara:strand:- start:7 stop:1722 length:1716 start_codon:yes stop_codon:yes gene_type:complete